MNTNKCLACKQHCQAQLLQTNTASCYKAFGKFLDLFTMRFSPCILPSDLFTCGCGSPCIPGERLINTSSSARCWEFTSPCFFTARCQNFVTGHGSWTSSERERLQVRHCFHVGACGENLGPKLRLGAPVERLLEPEGG